MRGKKKKKSNRFVRPVALGPSKNQVGTKLNSTHAMAMRHARGGRNQVSGLCVKGQQTLETVEDPPPKEN